MAKTMRKKNLKIQIVAGNTSMLRFHVGFEIELHLKLFPAMESKSAKMDMMKTVICLLEPSGLLELSFQ